MFKKIGPGVLVAAAFIGPGTVTTCTLAGAKFGFTLLWAMLLSIIATIFLQEMSARIGLITKKGLAEVIKENIPNDLARYFAIFIILSAIVIGNAAYEGGNIGGATLGMSALFGNTYAFLFPSLIGLIAFTLLFLGNYKLVERVLVALVILMSLSFLISAIMTKPDIGAMLKGLFYLDMPKNSILTIIGLVGTTVVPYNLFLHASLVSEKWNDEKDLPLVRLDTIIAIALGGIVSMAIMVSAASLGDRPITGAGDLALALEPLYGQSAKYFIGIGLFAAGITSAITAPLAAAYVANSCFEWKANLKDWRFRMVWIIILALGVGFMSLKIKPITIIKIAQIANGVLLPIVAIFLVWVVNNKQVMGHHKNNWVQNIFAILIVIIAIGLGIKSIMKVIGMM